MSTFLALLVLLLDLEHLIEFMARVRSSHQGLALAQERIDVLRRLNLEQAVLVCLLHGIETLFILVLLRSIYLHHFIKAILELFVKIIG